MKTFETTAMVGPGGALTLPHVPFAPGVPVKVRVEGEEARTRPREFVFGLHAGLVEIADDFDAPLPDSFWFGEDDTREASA